MNEIADELAQKEAARRVYTWLRGLPVLSVPLFLFLLIGLPRQYDPVDRFLAAAIPATPYLLVLFITHQTTSYVFVKCHARQGFAIVGLGFLTAFASIGFGAHPTSGLGFFFIANGLLWWFGTSTGFLQVDEGVGMLVKESERLGKRSIKELQEALTASETAVVSSRPPGVLSAARMLAHGQNRLAAGERSAAVVDFVDAFNTGDRPAREQAASQLDALGEIEVF